MDDRQAWIYGLYLTGEPDRVRYVGQTISRRGVANRVYHHKYNAVVQMGDLPVQRWIRKHGTDKIAFRVLEETDQSKVSSRERYWIGEMKRRGLSDLNILPGGEGVSSEEVSGEKNPRSKMRGEDVKGIREEAQKRYVSATEAAHEFGLTPAGVSKILTNHTWYDPEYDPSKRVTALQHNKGRNSKLVYNRVITEQLVDEIREMYLTGMTSTEISRGLKEPHTNVVRALFEKYGSEETRQMCETERARRLSEREELRKRAVQDYLKGGMSQREIASKYGVTQTALSQWVRRGKL